MENDILEMIEQLYADVSEAWGFPLGNDKCIVERTKVLGELDAIKANLPSEIAEAKRLVKAKEECINNARREADAIKKLAEERARHLVEEQEIMRMARAQSQQLLAESEQTSKAMLEDAQRKSSELRRVANEYLDKSLRETEHVVATALGNISMVREQFAQISTAPIEAIEDVTHSVSISEEDLPDELRYAE